MKINRALVTGASGFIGRPLCQLLVNKGIHVRAIMRDPAEGPWHDYQHVDFSRSSQTLTTQHLDNVDTIFHLAGVAHAGKTQIPSQTYWSVNVTGTEQLLRMAVQNGVRRFIYFSSIKAINPNDDYGFSKNAAEQSVLKLGKELNLHVCILRPSLVYGPQIKGNILMMLKGINGGWFPPMPESGNARSMVSVDDLVRVAFIAADSEQSNGKIYTVADGQLYSTRQIYNSLREALGLKPISWSIPTWFFNACAKFGDGVAFLSGKQLPFNSDVLAKLMESSVYDADEICRELKWEPRTDFFRSAPQMVKSFKCAGLKP